VEPPGNGSCLGAFDFQFVKPYREDLVSQLASLKKKINETQFREYSPKMHFAGHKTDFVSG
jgi:hypothetical protein